MPPKKPSPTPAGKAPPARGTIMHMFANQPKSKPKRKPVERAKIPREFMAMEGRDDADREEREAAQKTPKEAGMRGGELARQGNGDVGLDGAGSQSGRRSPRKHDTPESPARIPAKPVRRSLSGKLTEKGKIQLGSEAGEDEEQMASGRRSPRKHAAPVPELRPSRAASSKSDSVRRTIEAGDDTDEASQSGRRSPRKHAGTPVPASRSGTPVGTAKDVKAALKRPGSTLSKEPSKTRRTLSPEQREQLFEAPHTPPKTTVHSPGERKMPVVEVPAYNPDWHSAISPRKKVMESSVKIENRRSRPSSRQSTPAGTTTGAAAAKIGMAAPDGNAASRVVVESPANLDDRRSRRPPRQSTPVGTIKTVVPLKAETLPQNGGAAGRVVKRTTRSNSAALESPGRGKRSRTGTPQKRIPPNATAKDSSSFLSPVAGSPSAPKETHTPKNGSSSFLAPLEDTPSPPPGFAPKPAITNSSFATNAKSSQSHRTVVEDTDAESSGSEDSLVDMVTLIRNNSRPSNSLSSATALEKDITRRKHKPVAGSPEKPSRYKFSLKAMVALMADSEKTDVSAQRVRKMMEEKALASTTASNPVSGTVTPHDGHARLLEELANENAEDGGKDAQKVLKAVKRAVPNEGVEMVYHFFETGKPKKSHHLRSFPKQFLEKEGRRATWHKLFGDRDDREACMQDNFFAQMVNMDGEMGAEMFLWVLDESARERDEMHRQRYVEMMLHAPGTLRKLMDPDVVRCHFKLLGAKKDAVNLDMGMELEPMQHNPHPGRTVGDDWGELDHFLRLLGHAALMMSSETREYALAVILRLCADKLVRTHITLQEAVQLALFKLAEAFGEEEWQTVATRISQKLYTALPTPRLLIHVFSTIPSRPRLHTFRRGLAYSLFLRDESLLSQPIHETFSISRLSQELETDRFVTSRETPDTEYADLDAQIQLLDIALDSGSSVTAPKLGQRHIYNHAASLGLPIMKPKLTAEEREAEDRFDKECDILSYRLKVILNRIQDLGPGHAERSNCRASLQCLGQRIEMTIRTNAKPRDSNFVMPEAVRLKRMEREESRGKVFLQKFLKKTGQGAGWRRVMVGGGDGGGDGESELSDAPESKVEDEDGNAQAEAQLLLRKYA